MIAGPDQNRIAEKSHEKYGESGGGFKTYRPSRRLSKGRRVLCDV